MKFYHTTLGCKVNQYESQGIAELFGTHGFETVNDPTEADVILVNSCTVTAESDRKTRQTVRHLKALNPNAVLILAGCMAEAFPEQAERLTEADICIGNADYTTVYETYLAYCPGQRLINILPHQAGVPFKTPPVTRFDEHTRAYLKIEDGCNRFCSYCIIPYARGRVRSKPIEEIRREAEALAANGYREIVLVGINLTAYGQDTGSSLDRAIEAAAAPSGIDRIRLGSMEFDQIDDTVLERMANNPKFCPQFHLSLQSGCDATLARMNRHYDSAAYAAFVDRIRVCFDNPSITTDVMVGFAGETNEDFEISRRFAETIGFARMHVFAYSRRAGTKAYAMPNQVNNAEKQRRSREMIQTAQCLEAAFCAAQVGRTESVLFETEENGFWIGYTKNYTRVAVQSEETLANRIAKVRITEAASALCYGILDME